MLLVYRPFDVGDVVEIGGVSGKVDDVSLVSTTIRTFDNKVVLVPNKNVWGQVITNATASDERRVDMVFGIGYGDDIDKAQGILEKIVAEHEKVLEEPGAGHQGQRTGRLVGQLHLPPVGEDRRLLGCLLGCHPQGEGGVRRQRHLDSLPAAGRAHAPGRGETGMMRASAWGLPRMPAPGGGFIETSLTFAKLHHLAGISSCLPQTGERRCCGPVAPAAILPMRLLKEPLLHFLIAGAGLVRPVQAARPAGG